MPRATGDNQLNVPQVSHLILRIGVRVALVTLLAGGATSHAAEAISREVAEPSQVLGRLLVIASITFIFTTTRAQGRVGGAGVDVARSDHRSGLPTAAVLPRPSLILVLVLVLVITPRSVLAVLAQPMLVLRPCSCPCSCPCSPSL
jgi:hypothetical protein